MKVPFYRHSLNSSHAKLVANVLSSPFLTSGSIGKEVESQLEDFFEVSTACLTNSWTNGAIATLLAIGIKPGDEVIVPAMTFIASSNVVELLGAKPVFVDVDPHSLLITPDAIGQALTARTRAVIPVHLYGQMCDMKGIHKQLSERKDIAVIEDAAHCFEGMREGDKPGKYSDAAIFSFYATKNITCGEGGAIISNNEELMDKIRKTHLHGMSARAVDRFHNSDYNHWDMECMGVKANLPDLLAALLPHQINSVHEQLSKRVKLSQNYRAALAGTTIGMQRIESDVVSAEHLFPIYVPPSIRDEIIGVFNENQVQVAVNYRSVPTLSYYRKQYGYDEQSFPDSFNWGLGTITLPLFPSMTEQEQDHVINVIINEIAPRCKQAS